MNPNLSLRTIWALGLSALAAAPANAAVRLPRLISDGMVLQRGTPVRVWGWADKGEAVAVTFQGKSYRATAGPDGRWQLLLPALKPGGPYVMSLKASNQLEVKDILVGDVWLASGQSNMELPMARVKDKYPDVIAQSTNAQIRQFDAPTRYSRSRPQADLPSGRWTAADPKSVLQFSAVGYFFAKELHAKYKVPIGLIRAAVGGSPAEAWLSADALKAFPAYEQRARQLQDSLYVAGVQQQERARDVAWYRNLRQQDQGFAKGQTPWYAPDLDTRDWKTMTIPGYWADQGLGPINGVVWLRKEVDVPAAMASQPVRLNLGTIVDADSVYLNGRFVGTTAYQYPPRKYELPVGALKPGKNVLVVRVINSAGRGGFTLDKPYELRAGEQAVDLRGAWQVKLGAKSEPLAAPTFWQWQPGVLYNGMVAPLAPYTVKGVIWYQGEANTKAPKEYLPLMSSLIGDWRRAWNQPAMPFLYVQLANFMAVKEQPTESSWAELRDQQRRTLAAVPHTAMAVAIDLGEWNDIHPLDKQSVGHRLALAAEKDVYGESGLVASGPLYQGMKVSGNKITLSFTGVGGGLVAKGGGELKQFAIAGPDQQWQWAQARIEGDKVVVWNEQVPNPVAVRYAWADNPEGANLYNKAGLPASPFRTDH
ncbi:sialate O-acetylesterase [Hymenobacter sp. 15J16-1T3B]|uniref:sialate O-acetylesterase n=1 Tax=Hymenobacter sp. 15J16-1T3B TaxID=2886941 RepID=UPI001D10059F|nr:sialate O-acetylesterase [Hymenobacter sp. 15J16-1T3B]MCC3158567.1 sialate O-acetylesterase [Hymenobacter sp. 15J16-1T3B]